MPITDTNRFPLRRPPRLPHLFQNDRVNRSRIERSNVGLWTTLIVNSFPMIPCQMSSRYSWRECREEGPKTHTNNNKQLKPRCIPKPERKWLHKCERILDWVKRWETLQMKMKNALDVFEENAEMLLGYPYGYFEMTC